MKCKKCGFEIDENIKTCPKCGLRIENVSVNDAINLKNDVENENLKKEDSPLVTIVLVLLTICICLGGFYLYKHYKPIEGEELDYVSSRVIDYKEKGYTVVSLDEQVEELDRFSLINTTYDYVENTSLSLKTSKTCNTIKRTVSYTIVEGVLTIGYGEYTKTVEGLEAKYILDYNMATCECTDYNLAILTKDGYVYTMEMENVTLEGEALVDYIANNFKKIDFAYKVKSFAVSSYVGEANPCGEKVLVLLDEYNTLYIYKDNTTMQASATYSLKIYNVLKNEKNYYLFINPDRTMQVSDTTNDEANFIMDASGNNIKYYGTLSKEDGSENYVLSTDGYLYKIDYSNLKSITAHLERSLKVKNIGYKFDLEKLSSTYVIIYEDGSSREYNGTFESHGVFTIK